MSINKTPIPLGAEKIKHKIVLPLFIYLKKKRLIKDQREIFISPSQLNCPFWNFPEWGLSCIYHCHPQVLYSEYLLSLWFHYNSITILPHSSFHSKTSFTLDLSYLNQLSRETNVDGIWILTTHVEWIVTSSKLELIGQKK